MHIAVVGDAFVDVLAGPLQSLPSWGKDLECPSISQLAGGSALNVAVHLATLCEDKNECSFHALVGNDGFATVLRDRVKNSGVLDCMHVSEQFGTGVCIVLSGNGERGFITQVGATAHLAESHLESVKTKLRDVAGSGDNRLHVHVSGFYSTSALQPKLAEYLRQLRFEAESSGVDLTITFDTNGDATDKWDSGVREVLAEVDVFLPNDLEAMGISQQKEAAAAADVLAGMVRRAVVVTCGPDGAVLQRVWRRRW